MALYQYATKELSISNAKKFLHLLNAEEDTSTTKNSVILYAAIGRSTEWSNDPTRDEVQDNIQQLQYDTKRRFIGAKKINNSDVSHVAPRYDWTTGTVYAMYRDTDEDMYDRQYYVITDQNNVYKCLYNNKGGTSTVKPTGFSTLAFTTSDSYMWKYMYTVDVNDADKFLTTGFIPVKTLTSSSGTQEQDRQIAVQNAAVNGEIQVVETVNAGSGYHGVANGAVVAGGKFSLQISNPAQNPPSSDPGFYNGGSVYILSGTGAGQLRRITKYETSGSTRTLTVNTAFSTVCNTDSRFIISPTVTIIGDGRGAKAYSSINANTGALTGITVIDRGSMYTRASVVITSNTSHGSGATANAYISPIGGHGSDPIGELYADRVMLNVKLQDPEGNYRTGAGYFPSNTDFRTINIIKDPVLKVNSNNVLQATETVANTSNSPSTLRYTTKLTASYSSMNGSTPVNELSVGDIISNERVLNRAKSGALEFVTDLGQTARNTNALSNAVKAANGDIVFISDDPAQSDNSYYNFYINNVDSYSSYAAFQVNDNLIASDSETVVATVTDINGPEANTFSGEILYTEHVEPVSRVPSQIEDIKIILDF